MKSRRQMLILQILRDRVVETQEELSAALREEGVKVTQATVSRDIKDLQLVKVPSGEGRYRYALPEEASSAHARARLSRLLRDCLVDLDHAENMIVVKTLTGTASAAGEAIDRMGWTEIVGSVAGDNTVLVIARSREAVPVLMQRLRGQTR